MKRLTKKQQVGQSMAEYAAVTTFFTIGIVVAVMEGGDLDYGSDDLQTSIVESVNTHEQRFKNQMMAP